MKKDYQGIKETFEARPDLGVVFILENGDFFWNEESAKHSGLEFETVTREEFFTPPKVEKEAKNK
jgi:hypothetical protein